MAFREIPIDTDLPDQEFTIDLDGVTYTLRFKYNFRAGRWTMDIKTDVGDILLAGVPLVTSYLFLRRFKDVRLPEGEFLVYDTTGKQLEASELSWGSTHSLMYREAST